MGRIGYNRRHWIYPTREEELRGIASVTQVFVDGWEESVLQSPVIALMAQIRQPPGEEPVHLDRVPELVSDVLAERFARDELARQRRLANAGSPFIDPGIIFPTFSKPRPWWQRIIRRFTHGR